MPASYFSHLKEPYAVMAPINVLEELIKPFTLALRLFGNIFAGGVMLADLHAAAGLHRCGCPTSVWKLFDLFIGADPGVHLRLADDPVLRHGDRPKEGH